MADQPRSLADLIAQGEVAPPPVQLDQDGKEALAEAGTSFTITSIQFSDDSDFGSYFQFEVQIDGKPVSFRLTSNEHRDSFIESLMGVITAGPISGVRLKALGTRGGNKFLTIEPA